MTLHTREALPAASICPVGPLHGRSRTNLEISDKMMSLAELLDRRSIELTQSSEDQSARAWIWQSLEDIEATIIGLARSEFAQPSDGAQFLTSRAEERISERSLENVLQHTRSSPQNL
jgi:hypothetical protein